jgi:hypothetical protein
MILKKVMPAIVLLGGLCLGYMLTSVLYVPTPQQVPTAAELASALDANCSAVAPEMPICEMPGEISRADMFRLVSSTKTAEYLAQATPQESSAGSSGGKPNILVIWADDQISRVLNFNYSELFLLLIYLL